MIAIVQDASPPTQDGAGLTVSAEPERVRKIIHVDMDAFFASVEQRDDPQCAYQMRFELPDYLETSQS